MSMLQSEEMAQHSIDWLVGDTDHLQALNFFLNILKYTFAKVIVLIRLY